MSAPRRERPSGSQAGLCQSRSTSIAEGYALTQLQGGAMAFHKSLSRRAGIRCRHRYRQPMHDRAKSGAAACIYRSSRTRTRHEPRMGSLWGAVRKGFRDRQVFVYLDQHDLRERLQLGVGSICDLPSIELVVADLIGNLLANVDRVS